MARRPRQAREILVSEPQIAQTLTLINQFVRGGQQRTGGVPLPLLGVGVGGGNGNAPLPRSGVGAPPPPPGSGPTGNINIMPPKAPLPPDASASASRAPQFLLNRPAANYGAHPPGMPPNRPGGPPRPYSRNVIPYAGAGSGLGGSGSGSGSSSNGSGSGLVQTLTRGNAKLPTKRRARNSGGRRGDSKPPAAKKKAVDDLL